MKKSIKKHLKVGSIVILKDREIFRVTELLERKFKCELIYTNYYDTDFDQEFYYNAEMTIYNEVASNVVKLDKKVNVGDVFYTCPDLNIK